MQTHLESREAEPNERAAQDPRETAEGCCDARAQATCCAADEKAACCGTPDPGVAPATRCGCR